MLDDNEYSSDSSDEDYNPCGAESDVEEPSGAEITEESAASGEDSGKTQKKKKLSKKKNLNTKKLSDNEEEEVKPKEINPEENKERIDNLWASFKKDVDEPKKTETDSANFVKAVKETTKVVEEYEFAGEKVKVTREVAKVEVGSSTSTQKLKRPPPFVKSGGLSGFASQLSGKKPKLTTLEKSKLDWDGFKKDEGIEEDLKTFNQGKQGFLERKAFLERTDLKQFEIERGFRLNKK